MSQCNDFEHVLEPDDGHIGLKHVVRKKIVSCECVKVTDENNVAHRDAALQTCLF
jgi:hypothetical protein